jgi:hypothetical protein
MAADPTATTCVIKAYDPRACHRRTYLQQIAQSTV